MKDIYVDRFYMCKYRNPNLFERVVEWIEDGGFPPSVEKNIAQIASASTFLNTLTW